MPTKAKAAKSSKAKNLKDLPAKKASSKVKGGLSRITTVR